MAKEYQLVSATVLLLVTYLHNKTEDITRLSLYLCSINTVIKDAAVKICVEGFVGGSGYSEFVSATTLCALGDGPLQQVHRSPSSVQSGHCALSFHR